jgi:hypothetical protein
VQISAPSCRKLASIPFSRSESRGRRVAWNSANHAPATDDLLGAVRMPPASCRRSRRAAHPTYQEGLTITLLRQKIGLARRSELLEYSRWSWCRLGGLSCSGSARAGQGEISWVCHTHQGAVVERAQIGLERRERFLTRRVGNPVRAPQVELTKVSELGVRAWTR